MPLTFTSTRSRQQTGRARRRARQRPEPRAERHPQPALLVWGEECEGREGLQVLGAQLARLHADMREWGELKRPAALFAARSRGLIG